MRVTARVVWGVPVADLEASRSHRPHPRRARAFRRARCRRRWRRPRPSSGSRTPLVRAAPREMLLRRLGRGARPDHPPGEPAGAATWPRACAGRPPASARRWTSASGRSTSGSDSSPLGDVPAPSRHERRHCATAAVEVCSRAVRGQRRWSPSATRRGPRAVSWDVLVVGGGVMGWSVAHHLARAGTGRILVVDRGGGSTERATGGFRAQFATEVNVRLSLLSRQKLQTFREETGVDPGLLPGRATSSSPATRHSGGSSPPRSRCSARAGCDDARAGRPRRRRRLAPCDPARGAWWAAASRRATASSGRWRSAAAISSRRSARAWSGSTAEVLGLEPVAEALRVRDLGRAATSAAVVVNAAGAWAGTARSHGRASRSRCSRSAARWR